MCTIGPQNGEVVFQSANQDGLPIAVKTITLPQKVAIAKVKSSHSRGRRSILGKVFSTLPSKIPIVSTRSISSGRSASGSSTRSAEVAIEPTTTQSSNAQSSSSPSSKSTVPDGFGQRRTSSPVSFDVISRYETAHSSELKDDSSLTSVSSPDLTLKGKRKSSLITPEPLAQPFVPPAGPRGSWDIDIEEESASAAVEALPGSSAEEKNLQAHGPSEPSIEEWQDCITTATPKARVEDTPKVRRRGRRTIVSQKHLMQAAVVLMNGFFIFVTWWWPRFAYVLLPFITATVALNSIMVFSIGAHVIWHRIFPEKQIMPEKPENLVLLIPCYNETMEEMTKSLDSLVTQKDIGQHPQAVMIICDGKVRGPGMDKTTADYLFEDILVQKDYRVRIRGAYLAWDQEFMDVVVQKGTYRGVPYFCIVKQQNQGKRDSLIVVRSFLYNYNVRAEHPETIFSPRFFGFMASFLKEAGIDNVDHLVGMDADTVFDDYCISELLKESRYPHTVGVCGYVAVDWKDGHWDPWRLYQSAEYTIAQGLRRLHQSIATHKVSCLPGCCQLLKICEETCGQEVLVEKFGYCPTLTDGMLTQIRATASEDRNHVCHMLSMRPKVQTRQALKAKAYTDVPYTWSVFLSQRRRWSLGATSNDLLLVWAPGVQWFERIIAVVNCLTWFLNFFIFASVVSFIFAMTHTPAWIIMCFVSVMLIPLVYYLCIPLWLCKAWRDRFQFWAGCALYTFCGPFINISVLLYSCWNMDSFGWGKTRKVIAEDAVSLAESVSQPDSASKKDAAQDIVPEPSRSPSLSEKPSSEKGKQKQLEFQPAQDDIILKDIILNNANENEERKVPAFQRQDGQ
ncbi:CAZyme family GT2 [Paecilomyces variotii]|nr:CAZyme family GT2 [Paecilomyces variotii]